jgi:predicted naringenin-chalcone synthase
MAKLLANSGTGDKTHWPPGTIKLLRPDLVQPVSSIPPVTAPMVPEAGKADTSLAAARAVAENILCNCFEQVLVRTGIKARDVDFLIVNCSLFCPTPSLCAIIATRFSLKATTRTYNLGGMGCSASLISIDLAKQLLQNNPNSIAVVLSTEEITQNMYLGAEKSMLLQNTLFRVGGAGIALSNKPIDGFRAKYKLLHTVRVQDNSEVGHRVVFQTEDSAGNSGCQLGKEITKVAGKALVTNFTILGPRVLPIREQLTVVMSLAHRWIIKQANRYADAYGIKALPFSRFDGLPESPELDGSASPDSKVAASAQRPGRYRLPATYVPDFKRAVQHFCIHAGGRAVIDGIEQNLSLDRWQTAPSRATLYHWGNTSSSSVWYELRYCEGVNDRGGAVPPPKREASGAARASSPASGQASMGSPGKNAPNPDAEAAANGWDTNDKWSLPEYRGRTVRTGDRIVQIAFGAGFKCNSAVLLALRDSGDKR